MRNVFGGDLHGRGYTHLSDVRVRDITILWVTRSYRHKCSYAVGLRDIVDIVPMLADLTNDITLKR